MYSDTEKMIAMIPARKGSKGLPNKNTIDIDDISQLNYAEYLAKQQR